MKALYFVLSFSLFSVHLVQAAAPSLPKVNSRVAIAVPAVWDDASKTVHTPPVVVQDSVKPNENCTIAGDSVFVTKVAGGEVFFDSVPSSKLELCAHMKTSLERFQEWNPSIVSHQKAEFQKKQDAFKAQLAEDIRAIIEKDSDPCTPPDEELKTNNVYKLGGKISTYGSGTAGASVEGKSCQMELGSLIKILGFSRSADFAVAEYHRLTPTTGKVAAGFSGAQAETCKIGERMVFSLSKLKSHIQFLPPTTEENLEVKGIASVFNSKPAVCINDLNNKNASSSNIGKGRLWDSGSESPTTESPGPGNSEIAQ